MKKLTALILSLVLILSCSSAVFAAETGKAKIGIDSKKIEIGTGTDNSYKAIVNKYPAAARYIYNELKNNYSSYLGGASINMRDYNIPRADGLALYYGVINENYDLYHMNLISSSQSYNQSTGLVTGLKPFFLFDTVQKIENAAKAVEKQIRIYLKGVDANWSDFQKIRYLHDLLATQTAYVDTKSVIDHSAYGILVNKQGVCQGYSHAYGILLNKCGIYSTIATSDTMKHEWNQVELDNKFYNVDVTWDDPMYDNLGFVKHEYFLSSDTLFASEGTDGHYDWRGEEASDTAYDEAWWKNIEGCIYYDGENNKEYYIKRETNERNSNFEQGTLTERNCINNEERALDKVQKIWPAEGGYAWQLNFTKLSYYDGYFYYNSPTAVYKMKPDDSESEVVFEKDFENGETDRIYGLKITSDGHLYYAVNATPNDEDTIYTYDLKNETERAIDTELTVDEQDPNFQLFGIIAPDDGYNGLNLLGVQLKSFEEQNSMRFISLVSSDVLKQASEYGYVFTTTSKETATAKSLASKLTVENGHKYNCTNTLNTMTGNYGSADFDATGYKYVTAAINNISGNYAIVARLYFIDNDGNVHYGKYTDSNNLQWDGCAARLSDLV